MTRAANITMAELCRLAVRAFGTGEVALQEDQVGTPPTGWRCVAQRGLDEVRSTARSQQGARRQLRDLLVQLAGDGDLRTLDALQPGRELTPPERFQLYRRGLRDGVAAVAQRHPTYSEYVGGYSAGRTVAGAQLGFFAKQVGYDPMAHILRTEGEASNG